MQPEKLEIVAHAPAVRVSRKVHRDVTLPSAELIELRATLAAHIVLALDAKNLSVRDAAKLTGMPHGDISRICDAKLGSITVDRLMTILDRLGQVVFVKVDIVSRAKQTAQELS